MAINSLRHVISKNLSRIGFRKVVDSGEVSPRDLFKRILLNGDGITYHVIDNCTFKVSIQDEKYYRSLISDYKYYSQRIKRQRVALLNLITKKDTPSAWVLITGYYLGYYSAIEILRLCGIYHVYLDSEGINDINSYSETSNRVSASGVYSSDAVHTNMTTGDVTIRFTKSGSKPHDIAWSSISSVSGKRASIKQLSDPTERAVTLLFKDIVDRSNNNWVTPNVLRNDWNYARVESYSLEHDQYAREMSFIIGSNDYGNAKSWSLKKNSIITEESVCAGLAFVVKTLEATLLSVEAKLV